MKLLILGFFLLATLCCVPIVFGIPGDFTTMNCHTCHGTPPGTGDENERFYPGAHLAHKNIDCVRCHREGIDPDHVNGIITITPEVGYGLGTNISWPGRGNGSCGNNNGTSLPSDCHTNMRGSSCLWQPGESCKPLVAP